MKTPKLIIGYSNTIREGYQHSLDSSLQNSYDYPRNRNTINGIKRYIKRINKLADIKYPDEYQDEINRMSSHYSSGNGFI